MIVRIRVRARDRVRRLFVRRYQIISSVTIRDDQQVAVGHRVLVPPGVTKLRCQNHLAFGQRTEREARGVGSNQRNRLIRKDKDQKISIKKPLKGAVLAPKQALLRIVRVSSDLFSGPNFLRLATTRNA